MPETNPQPCKTKVLVNVYEPLIAIQKHKFDAACLKRDTYLDKVLRIEACILREELNKPNSDQAKSFITDNLKQLRLKPLNLLLSAKTVDLMNTACKEKNIPRDAFINRIFLLLIASYDILDVLFEDEKTDQNKAHRLNYINDYADLEKRFRHHSNVIDTIEEFVDISPFWRLRIVLEKLSTGTYSHCFSKNALSKLPNEYAFLKTDNIFGFNVFMSDDEVLKQEASDKAMNSKAELDKLLTFAKQTNRVANPAE